MNEPLIFRIILAILFVLVIGTRRFFERRSAQTVGEGLVQDRDTKAQIALQSALLTVSNLAMIVHLINPGWMAWSALYLPAWVGWTGALLGAAGCALLIWTHQVLGANFFGGVKIRPGHQLITGGPYRWVRHPMYTTFILLGLAWFGLSGNWFIAGFWLAATLLVILTRMKAEEQVLLEQFGEEYRNYAAGTGRLLPKL